MKTILIPTDFSPAALNAAHYAVEMALSISARLVLLHVCQIPAIYPDIPTVYTEEDMRKEAVEEMNHLKAQLMQQADYKLAIDIEIITGLFFPVLESVCKLVEPHSVVMGCQGTTSTERFLFGGHAVHTMKQLMWPVITVPVGAVYSSVKKIGLACDFDHVINSMRMEKIKMMIKDFDAALFVLNTGKREVFDPEIVYESGMLQEILAPIKPHFNFIDNADTDQGILDFVENNDIDMLVVLPKRHSFLERLIHKSHTRQLILHSRVPVMAIHC
ncbi:MAG: universal stress protein [Ferruginibacter sp.]